MAKCFHRGSARYETSFSEKAHLALYDEPLAIGSGFLFKGIKGGNRNFGYLCVVCVIKRFCTNS